MNRLEELLLLWQDGTLQPDESAELKKLLRAPEGRARAAENFFLTGVVLESLLVQRAAAASPAPLGETPAESLAPRGRRPAGRRRLLWFGSTAAAVLVALSAFWLTPAPDGARVVAQFEQVHGETFVISKEARRPALAGQTLVRGQGIATQGAGSEAVVQLEDAVRLTLGGDTMVFTTAESDRSDAAGPSVVLEQGELSVQVTRSLKQRKMTVETPLGRAVAETEQTALHVSESAGVVVVRGKVTFIHKGGKSIPLQGGQYLVVTGEGDLHAGEFFAGNGQVWATFPQSGLDTSALGFAVAFSPDGRRLAAVGRRWEDGGRLGLLEGGAPSSKIRGSRTVCFSPDGRFLATPEPGGILLSDSTTGDEARVLVDKNSRSRGTCMAFAPNGRTAAVAKTVGRDQLGVLEIWDVETGALRHTCRGHVAAVNCLAYSPDSQWLASGSLDKTVVLWNVATGQEQTRVLVMPPEAVWSVAFAPDGKTLAFATGTADYRIRQPGAVKLWDVASETVRTTLRGHDRSVTSVVFSSDGQTLITGSADTTVRFWDLPRGREYGMLKGHQAAPGFEAISVALSPDGRWLATVSFDLTVKLWKTTRMKSGAGSRLSAQAAPAALARGLLPSS